MKRFIVCALAVALFAMPVLAQQPSLDVWLQATDGSDKITVGVSQTAVIQLWMTVGAGWPLVNVDATLQTYDANFTADTADFDVYGFNDITITNSQLQRQGRGFPAAATPGSPMLLDAGGSNVYQYIGADLTAFNGTDGILGARSVLLDEIIIHGVTANDAPSGGIGPNLVVFDFSAGAPGGFYMQQVFGNWSIQGPITAGQGTGNALTGQSLLINVTPEPASLGLLLIGGIAALRRRR